MPLQAKLARNQLGFVHLVGEKLVNKKSPGLGIYTAGFKF